MSDDPSKVTELFKFNSKVVNDIVGHHDVLVHEATHMIQDTKKLKISMFEMEMDAHFAQALYLVKTKQKHLFYKRAVQLMAFKAPAEDYANNSKHLTSWAFRKQKQIMKSELCKAYYGYKDFDKAVRLDGLH